MTTIHPQKFTCPLCGNMFESKVITSTNTLGPFHSDFYREAQGEQPICYFVQTCTNCGYSGYEGDFEPQNFSTQFRRAMADNVTPEVKGRMFEVHGNFYLAALCAEWRGAPPQTLARIYHMGAWCSRVRNDREKENFYMGKAVEYFERALVSGQASMDQRAMFTYLIGDLYRRIGNEEKAKEWYEKVEAEVKSNGGEPRIVEFAKRQMTDPADIF
ncbi:MAG TPA: DUF2225 domain-containing protein [Methanocellaceae archaeon]